MPRPSLDLKKKIQEIYLLNAGAPTEREIPVVTFQATDKIPVPTGERDKVEIFCSGLNMMIRMFGALVTFCSDGNWFTVLHVEMNEIDRRYINVKYKDFLGVVRVQPVVRFECFKIFGGI